MLHGSVIVGDAEIFAICDLLADFPTGLRETFPNVPEEEWPGLQERYSGAFSGSDIWLGHDHCYLVRTPPSTVLLDTGVGPLGPGIPGIHRAGELPAGLEEIGVGPGDVDTVVFSHLHFDHVGWNLTEEGGGYRPTFGKARHVIHRKDWDVFEAGADPFSTAMFQQRVKPLEAEGLVELIDGRLDLGGGLVVEPAPGHTLGHVVMTVSSGDERVVLAGDLVNHPAQLVDFTWNEVADMDLDAAANSRRSIIGESGGGDAVLAPAHFPEPFGRAVDEAGRLEWIPEA
jgi:glyoxylase-like metal-dependent hydrolase (beta-lactamase superfamily II)